MKVFHINTVFGTGSTGRIVADLKHYLQDNGHQSFAVYGRGSTNEEDTLCVSNKLDLYAHALLTRLTDRTAFFSINSTKRIISAIKKFKPDIIHLHNLHGYYLNIELLFAFLKEYNKPVVWTIHDCWPFTGHCASFAYKNCFKWHNLCDDCPQMREYPSAYLDKSKKNFLDKKRLFTSLGNVTVVTPSYWLADQVEKSFLSCYKIVPVYNGIDLSVFHPMESNFKSKYGLTDKIVVLGVANTWTEQKGLNIFIDLSKRLPEEYKIVLIGVSKKQKDTLPDNIIMIERTNNIQELAEIYSGVDVLLNPSYAETFGMVTAEALACGTPVIVSDHTAVPEIGDEATQIVVSEETKYLDVLLEKKYLEIDRQVCAVRGSCFSKERMIAGYMECYEKSN